VIGLAVANLAFDSFELANDLGAFDNITFPSIRQKWGASNMQTGEPAMLEIFRTDPCNSQCAFPPFPDEPWSSSGASFVALTMTGSAGGLIAPDFEIAAPNACSPSTLSEVPNTSGIIRLLITIQAILVVGWWGARRRARQ
jgi:hypothetical protein